MHCQLQAASSRSFSRCMPSSGSMGANYKAYSSYLRDGRRFAGSFSLPRPVTRNPGGSCSPFKTSRARCQHSMHAPDAAVCDIVSRVQSMMLEGGMLVTGTGFYGPERTQIKALTGMLGARYSGELVRGSTAVLVVPDTWPSGAEPSEKYRKVAARLQTTHVFKPPHSSLEHVGLTCRLSCGARRSSVSNGCSTVPPPASLFLMTTS